MGLARRIVELIALGMIACFAATAAQAGVGQMRMGCRVLMDMGWRVTSAEMNLCGQELGSVFANVSPASYLRTTFTSADKSVGGRIELGVFSASNMSRLHGGITVKLRYAYGWWGGGGWRLTAGQTDNWFGSTSFAPKQAVGLDYGHFLMLGWGMLWPGLVPQVNIAFYHGQAGLQLAVEEPMASRITSWGTSPCTISYDMPRLSATLRYKNRFMAVSPGVSWSQVRAEGIDAHFTAWAVVFPVKVRAGSLIVKFQAHYGANFALEYPFYPQSALPQELGNGRRSETTCWGGMASLEWKVGRAELVLGAGYERFCNSQAWSSSRGYATDTTVRRCWLVGLPWKITKQFTIHPELACYDYGDNPLTGAHQGYEWIAGVQLRVIF